MNNRARFLLFSLIAPVGLACAYVLSVIWRVGCAEEELFGRNYLILPISFSHRAYTEPAAIDSYGEPTYTFLRKGHPIRVYKQMINGFQHAYGSALTTFELGACVSDALFRFNEYAEAILSRPSGTQYFFLDTKKDLYNNFAGRAVGQSARSQGLTGITAEAYLEARIVALMTDGQLYNHYLDPRVAHLPSLNDLGCPYLAEIQSIRKLDKNLVFR